MDSCPNCKSKNIKQNGPFAGRVAPGLKMPTQNDLTTYYECRECDFVAFEKNLSSGVRILTSHIVPEGRAKDDTDRVIVRFISDDPEENVTIKEFYIWIQNIYVQDHVLHLKDHFVDRNEVLRAAVLLAEEEFKKNGNYVPSYDGIDCRNEWGCCKPINNAGYYAFPVSTP
jgi:hypothetical protein